MNSNGKLSQLSMTEENDSSTDQEAQLGMEIRFGNLRDNSSFFGRSRSRSFEVAR